MQISSQSMKGCARLRAPDAMPTESRNPGEDSLTLGSDLEEVEALHKFIEAFCERNGVAEQVRDHLTVALEELMVNAIVHGDCNPREDAIRIELRLAGNRVEITFSDTGKPFNPLTMPIPDVSQDVVRRPIGGLGIYFVRRLIPEIRYERRDGRNCLFMAKPVGARAEPAREGGKNASRDAD